MCFSASWSTIDFFLEWVICVKYLRGTHGYETEAGFDRFLFTPFVRSKQKIKVFYGLLWHFVG